MPVEWTVFVGPLLALASQVVQAAGTAQRYRKKCQLLGDRAELISQHLVALQQSQWTADPPETKYMLQCLQKALNQAEGLVGSCQRKRKTFDFFKAFKNRGEFSFVNKRLDHIMDTFHMANRTLLMLSIYGDRVFMVVLETLLDDGACRRLPQDKREKLKEATSELPHHDNMPPEKKRLLELIRRELRQGSGTRQWDANDSGSSTSNDRGQNQNEHVMTEVTALARDIMEEAEAVKHNKDEVERVAQLAQQVASLLPHLQSPRLARHQELWRQLVHNLQDDLNAAFQTIRRSRNAYSCGAPLVSTSFSRQQAKQITEHGNKIEHHYQRLTFIIRQIIN